MENTIAKLNQHILSLEAEVRKNKFLSREGNIYLHTNHSLKNQLLLAEYIKLLKINLNYLEVEKLVKLIPSLQNALLALIKEMEIDPKMDPILLKVINLDNTEPLIKFANLRQQLHRFLTKLYAFFIDSYSLLVIPPANVQDYLLSTNQYRFNTDETELDLNTDHLKVQGIPNLAKFEQREVQSYDLHVEISKTTDTLNKWELFDTEFPEIFEDKVRLKELYGRAQRKSWNIDESNELTDSMLPLIIKDLIINSLTLTYTPIYQFIYTQLLSTKLPLKEVMINTQEKFGSIITLFESNLKAEYTTNLSFIPDNDQQKLAKLLQIIVSKLAKVASEFKLNPNLIYRLKFRNSSKFEEKYLSGFFGIDIYSASDSASFENVILSSLTSILSAKTYRISGLIICGEDLNIDWPDNIINSFGLNKMQKLAADSDYRVLRSQELQLATEYLTDFLTINN